MNTSLFKSLLIGSLAALITACGGGGGGSIADAGIGGSGITSVGSVTAIGSITVNGVKFDTQSATVTVDDSPGLESDLKVGLVTKTTGTLNNDRVTGKATRVEVSNELKGTVDAPPVITATGGTFIVFRQVVVVDANTVFDNATGLADLTIGMPVEVSGFRDATGQVRATRVEKKASVPATFEVKGMIGTVDNVAKTFTLGNLTVNFANAPPINLPASGLLTPNLPVEVKATSAPVAGVLTATSVEVRAGGLGQISGEVRLEGIMNGLTGSAPVFSFTVNGQNVSTNSNTAYDKGTFANLVNNIQVEVEGQITNGVLVAAKVKFEEKKNDVKITAQVVTKSTTAPSLTVLGTPGGVTVTTDIATIFQDNSSQKLRVFGFADVQVNDWLEIEAAKDGPTSVAATKVVRVNVPSNTRTILQGPSDIDTALPIIKILAVAGFTQTTPPPTQFSDATGPISQSQFFSPGIVNKIIKMRGQFSGAQINPVDEAQLQN